MASKEEIFEKLNDSVLWGEEEDAAEFAQEALDNDVNPKEIIKNGMSPGVQEAGDKFNEGEFFLPELMLAGEAMKAGLKVVMPALLAVLENSDDDSIEEFDDVFDFQKVFEEDYYGDQHSLT